MKSGKAMAALAVRFLMALHCVVYFLMPLYGLLSDAVDYIIFGTVIQEVKTSNVAREVRSLSSYYLVIQFNIWHGYLSQAT